MKYDSSSHITTVDEVKAFFNYLVAERSCNFHPDDDFGEYVYNANGLPMFSQTEISCFNRLMDECLEVCKADRGSIYDLGSEIVKTRLRKKLVIQ